MFTSANEVIVCGLPSSRISKSSAVRSVTTLPCASVTEASISTASTWTRNVGCCGSGVAVRRARARQQITATSAVGDSRSHEVPRGRLATHCRATAASLLRRQEIHGRAEFAEDRPRAFGAVGRQVTGPVAGPLRRGERRGFLEDRSPRASRVIHGRVLAPPLVRRGPELVPERRIARQTPERERQGCSSSRGSTETTTGRSPCPAPRLPRLRIERRPSRRVLGLEHHNRPASRHPRDCQRHLVRRAASSWRRSRLLRPARGRGRHRSSVRGVRPPRGPWRRPVGWARSGIHRATRRSKWGRESFSACCPRKMTPDPIFPAAHGTRGCTGSGAAGARRRGHRRRP